MHLTLAGYLGIQQDECESRSCCWEPAPGSDQPWCFLPQTAVLGLYRVAERTDLPSGAGSNLLLSLAQPILAQFGPDFDRLRVTVEPQTLQRLHIKISPADDESRWEVSEFLVPR
eukprot:gene12670-12797_t